MNDRLRRTQVSRTRLAPPHCVHPGGHGVRVGSGSRALCGLIMSLVVASSATIGGRRFVLRGRGAGRVVCGPGRGGCSTMDRVALGVLGRRLAAQPEAAEPGCGSAAARLGGAPLARGAPGSRPIMS
eukprot:2657652-Alexandrium_andersonii.AAC.1